MQNLVQIRYKHIFEQPEKSRSVTHGQDNPRTVAPCFDLPPRIGRNDTQHTRQTGRCQSPLLHLASQRQPCLIYAFVIFTVVQHGQHTTCRQHDCVLRCLFLPNRYADPVGIGLLSDITLQIIVPLLYHEHRLIRKHTALSDTLAVKPIHGGILFFHRTSHTLLHTAGHGVE